MCTLTFFPKSVSDYILTSNRDEAPNRSTIPPKSYTIEEVSMVFPKDEVAGGTWFGVSSQQRLICLLNGGFTTHQREQQYKMSRGLIVTNLLASKNALDTINAHDFNGIEPFTIVLIDWKDDPRLYELVWDGMISHFKELPWAPRIWSSSLLYSKEIKKKREMWFSDFILNNLTPSEEELIGFHKTAGDGNPETDVTMDRGFVKTKSITQFSKLDRDIFRYEDLETNEITQLDF